MARRLTAAARVPPPFSPQRNLNGGLFRPDPYDDSTVDDIAALDPRLKILQTRSEYRSESSDLMQTSSEELFDM